MAESPRRERGHVGKHEGTVECVHLVGAWSIQPAAGQHSKGESSGGGLRCKAREVDPGPKGGTPSHLLCARGYGVCVFIP